MAGQKVPEGREALRVIQLQAGAVDPPLPPDGGEAVPAFVRLPRHLGPAAQEQGPGTAQLQQFFRGKLSAAEVVRGHAGDVPAEMAVDAHIGQVGVYLQLRVVRQADDAVHLVLLDHLDAPLLRLGVEGGQGQDGFVPPGRQLLADGLGQRGEERRGDVGQDQGGGTGLVGFQPPGVAVHLVAQLPGGFLHPPAVVLAHGDAVEHLGHRAQRHPRLPGHILHGGGVFFSLHGFTSRFVKCFTVNFIIFMKRYFAIVFLKSRTNRPTAQIKAPLFVEKRKMTFGRKKCLDSL